MLVEYLGKTKLWCREKDSFNTLIMTEDLGI
jgi:hypothetical protein